MSWQAQEAVFRHSKQENVRVFRLLGFIAINADEAGVCDPAPKQTTLAADLGVTDRTVRSYINQLIAAGELERIRVGSGPGHPSAYRICLPLPTKVEKAEKVAVKGGSPPPLKAEKAEAVQADPSAFGLETMATLAQTVAALAEKVEALSLIVSAFMTPKAEKVEAKGGKGGSQRPPKAEMKGGKGGKAARGSLPTIRIDPYASDPIIKPSSDPMKVTTTTTNGHSRQNAAVVAAILDWMGFNGRLTREEQKRAPPELLLAWAYWVKLEGERLTKQEKNAVGIARSSWKRGEGPGNGLMPLAQCWLKLSDEQRFECLDAADTARRWPDHRLHLESVKLNEAAARSFYRLYEATGGCPAPAVLLPAFEDV